MLLWILVFGCLFICLTHAVSNCDDAFYHFINAIVSSFASFLNLCLCVLNCVRPLIYIWSILYAIRMNQVFNYEKNIHFGCNYFAFDCAMLLKCIYIYICSSFLAINHSHFTLNSKLRYNYTRDLIKLNRIRLLCDLKHTKFNFYNQWN